jgi:hypothetical protein
MSFMNHISPLDTSRFGFKIAKINEPECINYETIAQLKNEGVQLIMSRIPNENIQLMNQMEKWGYRVKDVQLT